MPTFKSWEDVERQLKAAMLAQRGAQAEVARRAGVSRPAVNEYVKTERSIPTAHLTHILDVLGVEISLSRKGVVR